MKKLNLLVVLNNSQWGSLSEKLKRLKEWYAPKVDFTKIDIVYTSFASIPFQPSVGNGAGFYRVDDAWYDRNVAELALGKYDIVLFVVPWKQWKKDNNAWGYKTVTTDGLVHIQIACDEQSVMYVPNDTGKKDEYGNNIDDAFFQEARHEILHGLFFLTGQPDTTHKWAADYNRLELALAEIKFSEATLPPDVFSKVLPWLALMVSWIKSGKQSAMPSIPAEILPDPVVTPPVLKYLWDTPSNVRHSVRVICDDEELDWEQKNTLTATIGGESQYNTKAVHPNYMFNKTTGERYLASTDWGLCQWNDYWHGKEIPPDVAMNDPERAVRLMCSYWKRGQRNLWIAYKNKLYKKYL